VKSATFRRRAPQQSRGQRRIETILDAAERLFSEVGYDGATTNAIASRAQTSIGSLYQFFPNKEAIVQGLAERYLAQLREVHARAFSPEALTLPLRAWTAQIVDLLFALAEANPGFQAIFCDLPPSSPAVQAVEALYQPIVAGVDALLASRRPEMDAARRSLYVQMACTAAKSLMRLADQRPEQRRELAEEIATLLARYLEPVFGAD
jgi:AcrR family transcriptional regulator